ncbi:epoxide hydrolase N-terminal domain-containing protein, partial [Streptomyces sp. NPDC127044]
MPDFLRSYSRRNFISTSATVATVAATGAFGLRSWGEYGKPVSASERQSIRPFRVHIPEHDLTDLRRRIKATRWPDRETVRDQSQGVQLATMKELTHYWGTTYNWRNIEKTLNSLPMYITEIDGLDIQFIHVRSRHADALPIILTHGWPGSILEFLKVIGPLS